MMGTSTAVAQAFNRPNFVRNRRSIDDLSCPHTPCVHPNSHAVYLLQYTHVEPSNVRATRSSTPPARGTLLSHAAQLARVGTSSPSPPGLRPFTRQPRRAGACACWRNACVCACARGN
jgi:hypothetical protein